MYPNNKILCEGEETDLAELVDHTYMLYQACIATPITFGHRAKKAFFHKQPEALWGWSVSLRVIEWFVFFVRFPLPLLINEGIDPFLC